MVPDGRSVVVILTTESCQMADDILDEIGPTWTEERILVGRSEEAAEEDEGERAGRRLRRGAPNPGVVCLAAGGEPA